MVHVAGPVRALMTQARYHEACGKNFHLKGRIKRFNASNPEGGSKKLCDDAT